MEVRIIDNEKLSNKSNTYRESSAQANFITAIFQNIPEIFGFDRILYFSVQMYQNFELKKNNRVLFKTYGFTIREWLLGMGKVI